MLFELNLTPTQSIIFVLVCLIILVMLWRYKKPQNDTDTQLNTKPTQTPKDSLNEQYGAYIWLSNKHYN